MSKHFLEENLYKLPVMYSLDYRIENGSIIAPLSGADIVIELRLPGLPPISHKVTPDNNLFAVRGKVAFAYTPEIWQNLIVGVMTDSGKVLGAAKINLQESFKPLKIGGRDIISAGYFLEDENAAHTGRFDFSAEAVNLGTRNSREMSCGDPSASSRHFPMFTSSPEPSPEHHILEIKLGEKSRRPMIVQLRAPKKVVKILPPYHEDVAVQTDRPATEKKKKTLKKK